jgi:signal transduction histidine kinase
MTTTAARGSQAGVQRKLTPGFGAGPDPRETLSPMLEGLSRALGYRRAVVALYDPARSALRGTVGHNVSEAATESLEVPLAESDNPLVVSLREGVPLRVPDVRAHAGLREHMLGLFIEMDMTSFVVAPLRSSFEPPTVSSSGTQRLSTATWQGREVSAVGVVVLSKDEAITDADIDRLMPFATQAGTALVRASDVERLRDTTEQHVVEKEWLWWMVNGVADPVILTDAENDIVHKNIRAESLFRASPDDSEGKRHAISMNNFWFTAALSTSRLDEKAGRTERELTLVDPIEGTDLLFEMITFPATNYYNGARGTVSVLKNITDLRLATEQLSQNVHRLQTADEEIRLERDRLNLILRSVPNPIILMDSEDQTILMNRQAARLFQASTAAEAQRSRRAQICVSNDTKFRSFVYQLRLDPAQGMSGEIVLTDPDSYEQLSMALTSTEVRDELGAVAATVSVMQDVSRLRELERRRMEQILFDSEKLAATGRLAASIAHEINNPLEAIKNSLYLLSNKIAADDPNHRFLQIATKETDRVSRILRQMLGFYRAPKMEPTDLNKLIEEAEALVEKHLAQHRVRIENQLETGLPLIIASADQMKQVLLNIMLNAQQAMPQGGVITVTTRASQSADAEFLLSDSVHIQIGDNGKGIPEEHLPHIFEPFFSTKEGKGTGLGLWVSYGIVQNHGGSIKVRSREGRGTTFSIALPIRGPADHADA